MTEYYCMTCDTKITEEQADETRNTMGEIYCDDCYEDTFDAIWEDAETNTTEAQW